MTFAPLKVSGVGLHTGADVSATLNPAPAGSGIVLRSGGVTVAARAENVVDTSRCTVLGGGGVTVSTVEHLLSACAGLGVTDLTVDVDGPELPISDGSASVWLDALGACGFAGQMLSVYALDRPVVVLGKEGAFVAAYPAPRLSLTVAITFDHSLVGTQVARFAGGDDYARDIAPARTFGFIHEVEALRAAGLARGGSFDNAVVVYPDHYSTPLRFEDELARHKLLDVMGDLLLATGHSLPQADIIAVKPSHRLNVALAAQIAAQRIIIGT